MRDDTDTTMTEEQVEALVRRVVAEMRAPELVAALRHAVSDAPHWRLEAENLLTLIDAGILPPLLRTPYQQEAA